MGNRNAVAFIAGLGSGILGGIEKNKQEDRQKKLDARSDQEFDWKKGEQEQKERARKAVADAAQPVTVNENAATLDVSGKPVLYEDADVAGSDQRQAERMGQTGTTLQPAIAAGGIQYDNKAAAQAAASAANTPEAVTSRQADALAGIDPERAAALRASARQGEAADLSIKQSKDQMARDKMFRDTATLVARGGWQAIPKVYENYNDGNTAQVIEDGKGGATVVAVDKDGKEVGRKQFGDLQQFILGVLPQLDPKLWVTQSTHAADRAQDSDHRSAVLAETSRHNQAVEKTQGELAAAKIEAATARAEAARVKAAAAGQPVAITAKELEDASKTIATRMTEIYQPKEGMTPEERDGLGKQRDKAASEAHGIYRINNTAGNLVDTGTAIYAARLAADPAHLMQRTAQDGKTYPGVVVNGQFVVTGPPLMKKEQPKPAPPPTVPVKPAASVAASRGLPGSLSAVPGVQDASLRVQRGTDLMVR
ncbi:MAG: hypothetical protein KF686_03300 [Ramlibacter sp.]|nr:hypothetical protein [Ramlibacter sp.]